MEEGPHHQEGLDVQQAMQQFWDPVVYQPWM